MNIHSVPGLFSKHEQIEIIKLLYKYNYPDCVGVEVGSLHGRSSYAISVAISKGKLYCIDLWNGNESYPDIDDGIKNNNLPPTKMFNTVDVFLENVKDRNNIIPIQGSSPNCVSDWTLPIDFIFLDGAHANPIDRNNIDFWLPKIKPGGTFLGHDWNADRKFPDVNLNVEYMEDLLKQKVTVIPLTSLWYFTLPKF